MHASKVNMVEPTCLITPSSFLDVLHKENSTMYGAEESVSFGRFMSEDNLEWEKWSTFNSSNRNRYVEEAEKYSKPGSVAQKKAYFEAHFKRMAALKAAALLEQANAAAENTPDSTTQADQGIDSTTRAVENLSIHVQNTPNNCKEVDDVQKDGENEDAIGFAVTQNEMHSSSGSENALGANHCNNVDPMEPVKSSYQNKDETCNGSKESQSCGNVQEDRRPLQKRSSLIEEATESIVKKNPPFSSYMSPSVGGTARASTTDYVGSVYPGKENYATPIRRNTNVTDPDKKKTPLRISINREINRIISPVMRKIGTSSKDCSTPLKTPAKVPKATALESPRMTPSRGARRRIDSFVGDIKASGSRWHLFSSEHKKNSPIIPNSFCMNGDRAARRKQKLEEKFNATATERLPQSSKFKEKAEAELNKFRQSFCFKAMSSPDHYGENEAPRSLKRKDESTQDKSPKYGKLPAKISLPPQRPLIKPSGSKNVQQNLWTKKTSK